MSGLQQINDTVIRLNLFYAASLVKIPNVIISNEYPLQGPVPEEPEPVPEELPVEGDSKQWTSPRVSADADGWPRVSLLLTPNAEMLQKIFNQGHLARISCFDLLAYKD